MPRWVDTREGGEEEVDDESTSEEEDDEEIEDQAVEEDVDVEEEDGEGNVDQNDRAASNAQAGPSGQRGKISISLGKKGLVCHVCGKKGHCAGFVGSVYHDCPFKPCYLCKQAGHTTMTCPFRIAPEHGCRQATGICSDGMLACVRQRELSGRRQDLHIEQNDWLVDAAVLKLHSRRCTCLEFHPTKDNIVVSGDKKGQVAIWDFEKVHERTVHGNMHRALTNNLRFLGPLHDMQCASASSDGLCKVFDVETGFDTVVLNMNPDGWIPGVTNERTWIMLYGLDVCTERQLIIAGDSKGKVYFADARTNKEIAQLQLHKKGNKVNTVHVNPVNCNLMMTGSNDWTARIFDIRNMPSSVGSSSSHASGNGSEDKAMELTCLDHPKVVNAAYFSPRSGSKIMTTCIDNRLRIWDYILSAGGPPDREIVHSHDFNRYLTPFRAEWDPKDTAERTIVVGRYISEDFGGAALHPVDIMDASTGRLLTQLVDANLATICPVNKPHPRMDVIISGSSRSLYAWRPVSEGNEDEAERARVAAEKKGGAAPSSDHFVSYDADDAATEKKKRKAASAAAGNLKDGSPAGKGKGKGKAGPLFAEDDDTPPSKANWKKKKDDNTEGKRKKK
ncbi:g9098 [Coccomyxa elongata]